ncbi:DUF3325 family protein [Vandammella animalimorsus]|uniref:DUF3325 family protein n=1 Tax=Vandammella animalimorsus TaxID=2029117 RepID=UPI00325C1324
MSTWHAMPLILALSFTGFVLLASAMQRHCDEFAPSPWLGSLRRRRGQGAAALGLALLLCLSQWPAALAVLVWLGLLTFAALALGLLLTYASARANRFLAWGVAACLLAALWPWLWRAVL